MPIVQDTIKFPLRRSRRSIVSKNKVDSSPTTRRSSRISSAKKELKNPEIILLSPSKRKNNSKGESYLCF